MLFTVGHQRLLQALFLAALLVAARPASAQYGMDFSVYTGIEWDGTNVYGWVDGYDNSWGCNHFDYAPWTQLSSPTRLAYGGSSSFLSFDSEQGGWEIAGGFTFMCSCVYTYVGAGPVQFQQVLENIPTSLSVVSDTFLSPPPSGDIYNRERHYQVKDQFGGPLPKAGMSVTESYSTPSGSTPCFVGGMEPSLEVTQSMTQGRIYIVDPSGSLRRMTPSAPENESRMQELVARYPELITDGDGQLLLIRREQSIADSSEGAGRWSLDHLFVTRDAIPVLVELKRAVDTRLRREVVGQILDYAANATAYWQAGRIADSFATTISETGLDPDAVLKEFIGEQDPATFWDQVDANFKAGRIKLVFVADEIPRELARIVEFLNDQMRADVRAIELKWFSGDGGIITLSPRVIGETERSAAAKAAVPQLEPITVEEWLHKRIAPAGEKAMAGAQAFVALLERLGGRIEVASRQGSIYAEFKAHDGKSFYPFHLWGDGQLVSLTFRWLHSRPALQDEAVRRRLLDSLIDIVGPTTTRNLVGFPSFKVSVLADSEVARRVETWLASELPLMMT